MNCTHTYRWIFLGVLLGTPGIARSQQDSTSRPGLDRPYTIRVNADTVVLHATVRNRKGIPVSGLRINDFKVYEDGVLQRIQSFSHEDIPVTVGLVVDNSGSMRSKRREVMTAALAFARSSNPADQMFVINFNEKVSLGLPSETPFTDQASEVVRAMSRVIPDGLTALYDALVAGLEHLRLGDREKKVLIAISDGGDNASQHTLARLIAIAGKSDAIIYTIGLFDPDDPDRNPRVLRRLARVTGGEAFLPGAEGNVVSICEQIARDIRNQYTIAYIATNGRRDGGYRVIQVKAETPGGGRLSVRTRTGYNAPTTPSSPPASGVPLP